MILEPFFATYYCKDLLYFFYGWCFIDQHLDQFWIILAEIVWHQVLPVSFQIHNYLSLALKLLWQNHKSKTWSRRSRKNCQNKQSVLISGDTSLLSISASMLYLNLNYFGGKICRKNKKMRS